MSSNLEKIIKIAAINSFNNDTVNTVLGYITDVSNNIADISSNIADISLNFKILKDDAVLQSNPVFTADKVVMNDLSANDASFNTLYVGGVQITQNGGTGSGGATQEQINQIDTNETTINDLSSNYYNIALTGIEKSIISDSVYLVANTLEIDILNVWSRENFFNNHISEISLTGDKIVLNRGDLFIRDLSNW